MRNIIKIYKFDSCLWHKSYQYDLYMLVQISLIWKNIFIILIYSQKSDIKTIKTKESHNEKAFC